MDDLVGVMIAVAVGAFVVALYVMVAGGAALALGALAAIDAVGTFVARLGSVVWLAVQTRGGDQRVSTPPEPAFEIYFSRPLVRDFRLAFGAAQRETIEVAKTRYAQASARFKGLALPLAWGVGVGAFFGAFLGLGVGAILAIPLGVLVLSVAAFVWVGSRVLQSVERGRRKLRGAHFDCPACHEHAPLPVYVCPACGAKHRQLLPGKWGVRHRRCKCDAVALPVRESGGRHSLTAECPSCSHVMPGAGGIVPEVVVPIVGGPKAGKTAFLASLLVELDERTQAGSSRLSVTEDSRKAFDELSGDLKAGRVPTKTQDRAVTPAFVAEVRSGTSRSALLYAHDVAGERFQQADTVRDMSALSRARGALILIDPFSLRAVGSTLDGRDEQRVLIDPSAEDPQSVVERFLQAMRETGRSDFKKLPVAVVVSKVDAIDAGDGIAPGDEGDKVSQWLETHGGGNLVRLLEAEFGSCRFFAASSLGRVPDPSNSSAFSPTGTLEPFFWLLSANRIAMNGKATETAATVTDELSAKDRAQRVTPWPRTPLLAPRPRSTGGYAAGVLAALAIFTGVAALVAGLSKNNTANASASTGGNSGSTANTGSTGSTANTGNTGNTGSASGSTGNTGSASGSTGNTGNTGNTGSASGSTGNTGSASGSTGNTGSTGSGGSGDSYKGQAFSISYPSGWHVQDAEQNQGGYTDTTIVSPDDPTKYIRVDVTSNPSSSDPMTEAQPVIKSLRKQDGYQQIDLSPGTFKGFSAVHWEFLDRESGVLLHKEDEFFIDNNGNSVAVLTQARAGDYAGLAGQFARLRRTLSMS